MIKIYCEDGAMTKEVKKLKNDFSVKLISFPFENSNKRTEKSKRPSHLLASSGFIQASSSIRLSDTIPSEKYQEIMMIIGEKNYNDVKHVDTAYKEKCKIFISPDKKDIINKGDELFKITGMKFFYSEDIDAIKEFIISMR